MQCKINFAAEKKWPPIFAATNICSRKRGDQVLTLQVTSACSNVIKHIVLTDQSVALELCAGASGKAKGFEHQTFLMFDSQTGTDGSGGSTDYESLNSSLGFFRR